jgi:hypothetical protein
MRTNHITGVILGTIIVAEVGFLAYSYVQSQQDNDFTCVVNLAQHYNEENYNVSLNYMIRGNSGVINMTGRSEENSDKVFNRKISFNLQRKGDLYYMISKKNIKLPDDNFDDEALSQYEPRFFITQGKEIYVRILKQMNANYLFMMNSIPTYVCNNITGDK